MERRRRNRLAGFHWESIVLKLESRTSARSTARSIIATFFSDQQKHENRKICPCVSPAIGVVTIDTLYRADAA
jgi:hypothetical protein